MEVDLNKIAAHYWLLRPKESTFHAYSPARVGAMPVCGSGQPIVRLKDMNIPSDRSVCCIDCFERLYGIDITVSSGDEL